ncbi:TolC family protein [Roseateles sp. BYS96W]|uniref:TolC family protein n=1 Tax=Pelomonas nitida TaxID=3299027 RepID=A0ABW7G8B4_9BURK
MRTTHWRPLLAAAWLWPAALPAAPLTLAQAQAQAAQHHPALAATAREVDASQGALRQAAARPNPAFTAQVEDWRADQRTTTATLDIPLELGGKRAARIAEAESARDVALAELAARRAELAARVTADFHAVQSAQQQVALTRDAAELTRRMLDATARRVAAGRLSPVDEARARVELAQAELQAGEAQAELDTARLSLAALLGDTVPRFDSVDAGDSDAHGGADSPARPAPADLTAALDASPALAPARREAQRRRAAVDVERSKATPDLTLSVGARRANDLGRTQAVIGFSVPLPLLDRNQGSLQQALARAAQADDQLQATRLALAAELQQAQARLGRSLQSLRSLRDTVLPAAALALDAARQGFEAGKTGLLDVLDAQRALIQARQHQRQQLAAAHQAAAVIDRILPTTP